MAAKRIKTALAFAIVAGTIFWLLFSGFNDNMQYFRTIEEVKAMGPTEHQYGLRVKGNLVPGSLKTNPDNLAVSFVLEDKGYQLEVHYQGELPDTFKDGSEVLVEGKYSTEGYFVAQSVKAKCASKYQSNEWYDVRNYDAATHRLRVRSN